MIPLPELQGTLPFSERKRSLYRLGEGVGGGVNHARVHLPDNVAPLRDESPLSRIDSVKTALEKLTNFGAYLSSSSFLK